MNKRLILLLIFTFNINSKIKSSDEKKEDEKLTTFKITLPNKTILFITNECPICLEEDKNMLKLSRSKFLPCGHHMHKKCLTQWMRQEISCPICRETYNKDIANKQNAWNRDNKKIIETYLRILIKSKIKKKNYDFLNYLQKYLQKMIPLIKKD